MQGHQPLNIDAIRAKGRAHPPCFRQSARFIKSVISGQPRESPIQVQCRRKLYWRQQWVERPVYERRDFEQHSNDRLLPDAVRFRCIAVTFDRQSETDCGRSVMASHYQHQPPRHAPANPHDKNFLPSPPPPHARSPSCTLHPRTS
jgi:hypothetical protein